MFIVLDSNPLHGRADLEAASLTKLVLDLAARTRARVSIPEPCLIELREGYREKLAKSLADIQAAIKELARLKIPAEPPCIDEAAALASYEDRLKEYLSKYDILRLPFPRRMPEPRALFEAAVSKRPPFDKSGNSYRDAVIGLSVEEFVRAGNEPALFVTGDGPFSRALQVKGLTCVSVDDAKSRLVKLLSKKEKAERKRTIDRIAKELGSRLDEITKRAAEAVEFESATTLAVELLSIDGFKATKVDAVDLVKLTADSAEFTAKIAGNLAYTVKRWRTREPVPRQSPPPKKVGYSAPSFSGGALSYQVGTIVGGTVVGPYIERIWTPVALAVDGVASVKRGEVANVSITGMREAWTPQATLLTQPFNPL